MGMRHAELEAEMAGTRRDPRKCPQLVLRRQELRPERGGRPHSGHGVALAE